MFFSRSYGNIAGGIEKMSIDLAQGLTAKGHKVTVISHDSEGAVSFFNWPVEVEWIKLGIGSINSKNAIYNFKGERITDLMFEYSIIRKDYIFIHIIIIHYYPIIDLILLVLILQVLFFYFLLQALQLMLDHLNF